MGVRRWAREHGLLLANAALFAVFLAGMAVAGWNVANDELADHGAAP